IPDATLAGIIAFYAIVNTPKESLPSVFREMKRVLRPGGLLLLAFHIGDETLHPNELWGQSISMDFFLFQPPDIQRYLQAAGLAIEEVLEREPYAPDVEYQSRRAYIFARKPAASALAMDSPAPKTIFHVDMDAFFVSVEELFDPSLKGQPVIVGGQKNERGVVSAASYAARKFGVHSAMPLRTAAKLCPHGVFVDGHPERYREYSAKVLRVLRQFSPLVEMASIDEAYIDMTGTERLHGNCLLAAHKLHTKMKADTQLNCSIGIAQSRLVAKVSSDYVKPNGILWVTPGNEAAFLAPLDVRKIPGVGKVMERDLHAIGIRK